MLSIMEWFLSNLLWQNISSTSLAWRHGLEEKWETADPFTIRARSTVHDSKQEGRLVHCSYYKRSEEIRLWRVHIHSQTRTSGDKSHEKFGCFVQTRSVSQKNSFISESHNKIKNQLSQTQGIFTTTVSLVAQLLQLNSLGERFYLLNNINISLRVYKGL